MLWIINLDRFPGWRPSILPWCWGVAASHSSQSAPGIEGSQAVPVCVAELRCTGGAGVAGVLDSLSIYYSTSHNGFFMTSRWVQNHLFWGGPWYPQGWGWSHRKHLALKCLLEIKGGTSMLNRSCAQAKGTERKHQRPGTHGMRT